MRRAFTQPQPATLLGAVAVALALAAPSAVASESPAAGPFASFRLHGSHGYRIGVQVGPGFAVADVKGPQSKGFFGAFSAYITFHGHARRDRIGAHFGRFGTFRARFEPSGKVIRERPPRFCKGKPGLTRFGVFEGTLRFRGEGGYTEVSAERAKGSVTTSPRRVCHRPHRRHRHKRRRHRHRRPGPLVTTFSATNEADSVGFAAIRDESDPTSSLLLAVGSEAFGQVLASHVAILATRASAFSFDPSLDSATIAPPAPFAGSAVFQRIDDFSSRWEGPLTVSFPGKPGVPLTGREFAWSLSSKRLSSSSGFAFASGNRLRGKVERAARAFLRR